MSTIEQQIQKLNTTNADLANKSNALTQAVQSQISRVEKSVVDAKNEMSSATTTTLNKVKSDAAKVNADIQTRMEEAIKPWMPAMAKVQFDALREQRKQQYAGSGFVEWGKHHTDLEHVNDGMWMYQSTTAWRNKIALGRGDSLYDYPVVVIDGVIHQLFGTWDAENPLEMTRVLLPDAPDGTKTYDSATGTVTQHSDAQAAFSSETATNKVITTRKDLVFLESWREDISEKDVVYPLGNVQYGASNYEGIALVNNLVAQGYCAFGEWDQNTKGYGVKWSSLTDEQKTVFLSGPEHNIYYDAKANKLVQVRYRMRVVEGVSDSWKVTRPSDGGSSYNKFLGIHGKPNSIIGSRFGYTGNDRDLVEYNPAAYSVFVTPNNLDSPGYPDVGRFTTEGIDKGFALPIALVQRLNQGAYHPVYNPMGTAQFTQTNVANFHWNTLPSNYYPSKAGCFELPTPSRIGRHTTHGALSSGQTGRPGSYKYHDAIYAGQVEDLRLNSNKLNKQQLLHESMQKAITGQLRAKGKIPFTLINSDYCHDSEMTIYLDIKNDNANLLTKNLPLFNRDRYFAYRDNDKFDIDSVLIKFLDYGDTDLGTYGGGHPLNTWIQVDRGCLLNSRNHIALVNPNNNSANWISSGRASTIRAQIIMPTQYQGCEFDVLPYVDIIGSADNIAATFPNGVVGQWNPNHIPDGSGERFALTKKAVSGDNDLVTFYNGEQWESSESAMNLVAQSNSISHPTIFAQDNVALYYYETKANSTTPASLSSLVSDVSKVWCGNDARASFGANLQTSLLDKVPTSITYTTNASVPLTQASILGNGLVRDEEPKHALLPHLGGVLGNIGCKALYSLTVKNGLYYVQFNGSELKFDKPQVQVIDSTNLGTDMVKGQVYFVKNKAGTTVMDGQYWYCATDSTVDWNNDVWLKKPNGSISAKGLDRNEYLIPYEETSWGDDQAIPLVNGEDVKTDLNGNTVKVFCHHSQFPIGIAHNN
ncbi:hypothetical protein HG263_03030 [Pseudoalteromonas sp. JBTF-M23]|uniref:Uncharacterized protein n=1 Tax=Pseudoalteromonas caenipelagi TaxID=2726988 RepID=A0A849V866_9GAMM|nr:hypothetical protein [Pseudoalteromonas caenipelagi]NOU49522.1 hypothetical protein [Pseudoalteromonas caenipelagi]